MTNLSYDNLSIIQNGSNTEITSGNNTLAILTGINTPLTEANFVSYGV